MSKHLILNGSKISASLLALMVIAGPAIAQDSQSAIDAPPELVMPIEDATTAPDTSGEMTSGVSLQIEPRSIAADVDAMTADKVHQRDSLGLVERQSRMGEDILLIDREVVRVEAAIRLIKLLGEETFKRTYPEMAADLEGSQIFLAAEADRLTMLATIQQLKDGPKDKAAKDAPKAREDGSEFFDAEGPNMPAPQATGLYDETGNINPALAGLIATEIAKANAAEKAAEEAAEAARQRANPVQQISVREIYGTTEGLTAIIMQGDERIRVQMGDELAHETSIEDIDEDGITINRGGTVVRLGIGR